MKRAGRFGLTLLLAAATTWLADPPARAQENDPWAPFQFLIGNWTGQWSAEPGESTSGPVSFSVDLEKQIIVRRTNVTFAAKSGETSGFTHEDLLVIYRERGGGPFRAFYVDREGFVINYVASFTPNQASVVFTSDPEAKGPRFKLVCDLSKDGVLSIDFLIAPPGGDLKSHVRCLVKRAA